MFALSDHDRENSQQMNQATGSAGRANVLVPILENKIIIMKVKGYFRLGIYDKIRFLVVERKDS